MATILRALAEAAGIGAREGRARLILELLGIEIAEPASVVTQAMPVAARTVLAPTPPAQTPPAQRRIAPAPATPSQSAPEPASAQASSAPRGAGDVAELRARWAEVVERANPVIKPLLKECRPIARDGARLTLAFPEGREFMRSRISQRSGAIEILLGEMFGGSFAIECVASNLELEPLTVEQAVGAADDPEARALLEGVLKITGGELVDAPEVR